MEDGKIVLGTALDTKQLEKQLRDVEKDLEKFQKEESELLKAKMEIETDSEQAKNLKKDYDDALKGVNDDIVEINRQLNDVFEQRKSLEFGSVEDTQLAQTQTQLYGKLEELKDEQSQLLSESQDITAEYEKQEKQIDDINNKLKLNKQNQEDTLQQQKEINEELKQRYHLEDIKEGIGDINKGLAGIVKKAIKWGLAIFGIRTMFNFIRSSMSTIAQDDPQLKADIDYIKNALAYTIEPIVRRIVEWAKQILVFVGALIYKWTGYNIFKDANKHLEKAKANANALQKTMAKFDEMSTLNKQSESAPNPSFDFASSVENFDFDKAYSGIQTFLNKVKIGFNTTFDEIQNDIEKTMLDAGASKRLVQYWHEATDDIQGAINGIGTAFSGVFDIIWGIMTGDLPKVKDGFVKLGTGIIEILYNVGKFIWDGIKLIVLGLYETLSPIVSWIWINVLKPIVDFFGSVIDSIITRLKSPLTYFKTLFSEVFGGFRQMGEGIVKFFKGDFKGGIESVFGGLKQILLAPINALIEGINQLIKGVNKIKFDVPNWVPGIGGNRWGFNLKTIPKIQLAKGGIINLPGKGVPIGNVVGGEVSREGVIPLTDSQQMSMLGEAIGKYISLNATIPVYVGNRQVAREMKKIELSDNFAFNR